jgi:molybdenum cofactor cytidylyltransferase
MPAAARARGIAGVLLAAGSSRRMGQNKLLLELEGQPLVRRVAGRAAEAGLDPILVVLGHEADRVEAALADMSHEAVPNPDHERGANSSLRLGLSRVPPSARAALVLLGDMPYVTSEMIRLVVVCYERDAARLVVSRYGEVSAPPTLYDASLFEEFTRLEGEGCGKQIVRRHWHEAAVLDWPESALADVDRPEDYERVRAHLVGGA